MPIESDSNLEPVRSGLTATGHILCTSLHTNGFPTAHIVYTGTTRSNLDIDATYIHSTSTFDGEEMTRIQWTLGKPPPQRVTTQRITQRPQRP